MGADRSRVRPIRDTQEPWDCYGWVAKCLVSLGGKVLHPPITAWAPWSVSEVAQRLSELDMAWCVAGGWALDLWHGQQTRKHEDIEIAILRTEWPTLESKLAANRHYGAAQGQFEELPHGAELPAHINQIWLADEREDVWRLEILLEPGDDETWIFRRNHDVRRQRRRMIATSADGVPYLKPEGVLLYKAKDQRPRDNEDFRSSLGLMTLDARNWLRDALLRAHPNHPWIAAIC